MEFRFQYTLRDDEVLAFLKLYGGAGWVNRFLYVAVIVGIAFACFFGGSMQVVYARDTQDFALGGLMIAAGFVSLIVVWRLPRIRDRFLLRQLEKNPASGIFERLDVVISQAGLRVCNSRTDILWRWSAVYDVRSDRAADYFMVSRQSGVILPTRIHTDAGSRETVLESARRWRTQSPPYEGVCPRCKYRLREANLSSCSECGWRREPESDSRSTP